jgi:putative ABC transport system substrate-binding protein
MMANPNMFARIAKFLWIFPLLWVSSGLVTPAWSAERQVTVALVIDANSRIHNEAVAGIKQAIDEHGEKNLYFRVININNPDSARAIKARDIDYAIVTGVKPALFALKHNPAYPVLYTLIPEGTYKEIIEKRIPANAQSLDDDYVIFLGQTASRQLALTRAVTGEKCRIGIVAGEYSRYEAKALQNTALDKDFELVVKQASSHDMAIDDIKQMLKDSDIYLALYDTNILNRHNAKWLLYMAYKMNKPVIGFSSSYTRAGAVASIFSTPEQIGRQSGEWLLDMLHKRLVLHHQHPKYFSVTTNPNIQRILRLKRLSGEEIKTIIQNGEKGEWQ